eukprot:gene12227-12365_t
MSEDLKEHFKGCDGISDAFITHNKDGRPSGTGFAVFSSAEAAYAAAKVPSLPLPRAGWFLPCSLTALMADGTAVELWGMSGVMWEAGGGALRGGTR